MANYLDFLVVLDEHIAASSLGYVTYGHELTGIAVGAGLVSAGDQSPARWTGECAALGYVVHGPLSLGDRQPLPQGPYNEYDLSRVSDYRITATGRTEADRVRRQRREAWTDAALGGALPDLPGFGANEPQRRAIALPLTSLRSALDNEHYASAIGAAKDLVEAACKVAIELAGGEVPSGATLPALFKEALRVTGAADADGEVGRSLAATVQRLAELRNAAGSGHGRAAQPVIDRRTGRLAASAAIGIAMFVLDPESA